MMREPFHPQTEDIELAAVMHALSDPVRLEIVARLADTDGENCGGIGDGIDVHKSTLSHHYRVLREAGCHAHHGRGPVTGGPAPHRRPGDAVPRPARLGPGRPRAHRLSSGLTAHEGVSQRRIEGGA